MITIPVPLPFGRTALLTIGAGPRDSHRQFARRMHIKRVQNFPGNVGFFQTNINPPGASRKVAQRYVTQ